MHAKRAGAIDGLNPVTDAGIPRAARKSSGTHAYSAEEVLIMLNTLTGTARAAVAMMYFAGLRPSEARGVKWSDYDAEESLLSVQRSIWRKHETGPKTEGSCGVLPVAPVLKEIIAGLPRISEFMLAGPSGKPVDLHNLSARIVVTALNRCVVCGESESNHEKANHEFERDSSMPLWKGWYARRRGLATTATAVDSQLAGTSLLRHSNIQTTAAHCLATNQLSKNSKPFPWRRLREDARFFPLFNCIEVAPNFSSPSVTPQPILRLSCKSARSLARTNNYCDACVF
jgi:hypothetical protein